MIPRPLRPAFLALHLSLLSAAAQTPAPATNDFLRFIQSQAASLRANDTPPPTLDAWNRDRATLRENLRRAWGDWPATPAAPQPKILGELRRDGYRIEKLIFQTLPGLWMTANAYVPDRPGKLPAVLCVHGHWRGAKQDPVVQSRCLGLAKLGFFVLVVDAFGAGERAVSKPLGEYHGDMTAATLFPVGLPLSGLQVYENMRAVDYLLTRPEVDGARLGITGASGGGNQSMYAGAFDERFKAVVPVCSVGNYQAYLGTACCMCEVVPGALRFTEEWGILGLVAPRALMVISATRDSFQFSVGEATKSLALTDKIFQLHGQPQNLRHAIFESPHAYNQPMREAMYGWMSKHLLGHGDGSPIPEPAFTTEDPETLRCFPGDTRPEDWLTIPKFAHQHGRQLLARKTPPTNPSAWQLEVESSRKTLADLLQIRATIPVTSTTPARLPDTGTTAPHRTLLTTEPGIQISVRTPQPKPGPARQTAIVLQFDDAQSAQTNALANALAAHFHPSFLNLRATGPLAPANDRIGRAPDHNTAEWSLWLGRPLLGQWVIDIRAHLDALAPKPSDNLILIGVGPAGIVALAAAALDSRFTRVITLDSLATYLTDAPYEGQRLGTLAPGIVRDVGDIAHLAALLAPRRLVIANPVAGNGQPLTEASAREHFAFTQAAYLVHGRAAQFTITHTSNVAAILDAALR